MTDPFKEFIQSVEHSVQEKSVGKGYTESYVAFLDILGMKELIKRPYEDLKAVFDAAEVGRQLYSRMQVARGTHFISPDHLKVTIMSDAIVLSIDVKIDYSFSKLVGFSSYLINSLLRTLDIPIFLRGGISRGLIYQDSDTVFGPGLVDAYNLENDVASGMRCIVSPSLKQDASVQEYLSVSGCALTTDIEDGLYFINFARVDVCSNLVEYATNMIDSDVKDEVKDKYKWLLRYIETSEV